MSGCSRADHDPVPVSLPRRPLLRALAGLVVGGVTLAGLTACGGEDDDGDDDDD